MGYNNINHHHSSLPFKNKKAPPRSQLDISADILTCLVFEDHLQPSKIEREVNIYPNQLRKYLMLLYEKRLIQLSNNPKTTRRLRLISITNKGKEFIHYYNKLKEIMQESSS